MNVLCPLRLDVDTLELGSPLPIDLDLIRDHVAVDGSEFDTLLTAYLGAAIAWAEGQMHRTIYPRSHRWVLRDFPRTASQEIRLPRGKTVSVESITYQDGGTTHTLAGPSGSPAGTGWQEDLTGKSGGVLAPVYGGDWPNVDYDGAVAPVAITFTAGYPTGEVPKDIEHALMFAIADMFDTRGSADLTVFGKNMSTRNALISPYKLVRWY